MKIQARIPVVPKTIIVEVYDAAGHMTDRKKVPAGDFRRAELADIAKRWTFALTRKGRP